MAGKQLHFLPCATNNLSLVVYCIYAGIANKTTDEFRRSARATKGQHTKMDQDVPASGKKARGKKGKKAAAEEEDGEEEESIRCVCGVTTDDGSGAAWIACDNCGVWQHNVCVGVSTFEDEIPSNYLCEQCDENFHRALLEAVAQGEKPWEQRKKDHQNRLDQEAREPKKRGRGKGKAKRASDLDPELTEATNGKAKSPSTPVPDMKKKDTPAKGGSSKRKIRDESQETAAAKVNKSCSCMFSNLLTLFKGPEDIRWPSQPEAKVSSI